MILNSKTKKKHFKLWTLRRNWYRLSLYYFSRKRRSLLHPKTVKSSFSRLKSYSWKTLGKIAPKSSLRCWVSVSDGAPAPSASHIGKKKLNIKWLNGRCWIQILTVFDSVNYQQFLNSPHPKKLTIRNAVRDKQTILSPFIELTN